MSKIKKMYQEKLVVIPSLLNEKNRLIKQMKLTEKAMKQGIPLISQPLLYNINNKTYGYPDLIIRSDYIKDFVLHPPNVKEEGCKYYFTYTKKKVNLGIIE